MSQGSQVIVTHFTPAFRSDAFLKFELVSVALPLNCALVWQSRLDEQVKQSSDAEMVVLNRL